MLSRSIRALGVLTGAAALAVGPFAVPAQAAPGDIQLLFVNDFHGRITTSDGDPLASHLAGAIDQLTAEATGYETRFVSAGDNVGASIFQSAVADDAPTIDILNEMNLLVAAVGNHEFDRGYDWLADPSTHGIDAASRVDGGPPATSASSG